MSGLCANYKCTTARMCIIWIDYIFHPKYVVIPNGAGSRGKISRENEAKFDKLVGENIDIS